MNVGIIGAGPIAQALTTIALSNGHEALLGTPGRPPRRKLPVTQRLRDVTDFAEVVLIAVPAWDVRGLFTELGLAPRHRTLLFTRGLDSESGRWLSSLVGELTPCVRVGVLAGPLVSSEVFKGIPTALVAASPYDEVAHLAQDALHGSACRVYTSRDPHAVELAATMVGVLAVAVGIVDGMGLGVGTRGVVVSRGLAEAVRLAHGLGVDPAGMYGLAGVGELFAAASNSKHPAYLDGRAILDGQDRKRSEPIRAALTALAAGKRVGVELPLTAAIHAIANGKLGAHEAMRMLMERPPQDGEV
ncbi:MAG: NAD(P)-binding domain-containing protein [Proteobacteria bacterium]|nr:NAD(P)-binding domain-containing protein [Pseudomonadota bacterium]MCP4920135.1 NAD(P)-binding domain-containing protein [Pseudomonadota bacterium]